MSYRRRYRTFLDGHILGNPRKRSAAFAGEDVSVAKYYDFDKDCLLELEPCSTHYEIYDTGRTFEKGRS
jgi:hypothetical protein